MAVVGPDGLCPATSAGRLAAFAAIIAVTLAVAVPTASAQVPGAFAKTAPASGTTAVPVSGTTISWGASTGATSYEYCVYAFVTCGGTWTSAGTALSANVTSLFGGQTYSWQVRARNLSGTTEANGNGSAYWTFTTSSPPGNFTKTAPSAFAALQPTSLSLTWGASSGATSYEYCYDTTDDSACSAWTNVGNVLTVNLTGLAACTDHYWQIRAMSGGGSNYADSSPTAFRRFTTLCAPTAFSKEGPPSAIAQPTSVTLTWGTSGYAANYEVCIDATNDSACTGWTNVGNTLATSVNGLSVGTTYFWQVRAANAVGTTYANGSPAAFCQFSVGVPGTAAALCSGLIGTVQALAVDPTDAQIVYAGTTDGIYKTTNGGTFWSRIDSGLTDHNVRALAIKPGAPCTIYAGIETTVMNTGGWPVYTINNTNAVLAFSVDCGATWGIPATSQSGRTAQSLAFSNASPSVLYSGILVNDGSCFGSPPFVTCIASLNGSVHRTTTQSFFGMAQSALVATDPANACTAYLAIDGTVYKNTSCSTFSWASISAGLSGTVRSLAVHPTDQNSVLAGATGGIYRKPDGLSPWTLVAAVSGSITSIVFEPGSSLVAYAAGSGGVVYKTLNGGLNWSPLVTIGSSVSSLAIGPATPTLVYVGTGSSVVTISGSVVLPNSSQVDLNGDGNGDAFVYKSSTGFWGRQLSQPGGTFAGTGGGWAPGWSVQPAHFNSDGQTDFFVFSATTGQWFKMLTDGSGFIAQSTGGWWTGWQRHVLDLDGDGISDFFLYDPVTGQWFKCISTPTGFTYSAGGWSPGWDLYPMKLNADAREDLFLINGTTGQWVWALTESGGGFTYPVWGAWSPIWKIYPGDFSGDGLSDLLLHNPITAQYYVATNTGAGFSYEFGAWSLGWTPYVVDLDGNDVADLFLYNTSGMWFELLSDGFGHFAGVGSGFWSPNWEIHPTDFNGDGRTDILLYSPVTGQYYQAWNLFLGSFAYFGGGWDTGLTIFVGKPVR